jgi:hypothetical protein
MRFKRIDDRRPTDLSTAANHPPEYFPVAKMHPIKIADGYHGIL